MYMTSHHFFPDSSVSLVHQTGAQTPANSGLEVALFTRENECDSCFAELASKDYGAEIGLSFEGRTLTNFDSAFCLPNEVARLLKEL